MSGLEAVARLHPDVVLLDVQLPDINGFEVAARLTENGTLAGDRAHLEPRRRGPRLPRRTRRGARLHPQVGALRIRAGGAPVRPDDGACAAPSGRWRPRGWCWGWRSLALILTQRHRSTRAGVWAAGALLTGWGFIGVGLYAWGRRPDNRVGMLMAATGFAWLVAASRLLRPAARLHARPGLRRALLRGRHPPAAGVPERAAAEPGRAAHRRGRLRAHDGRRRCRSGCSPTPSSSTATTAPSNVILIDGQRVARQRRSARSSTSSGPCWWPPCWSCWCGAGARATRGAAALPRARLLRRRGGAAAADRAGVAAGGRARPRRARRALGRRRWCRSRSCPTCSSARSCARA